MPPHPRAGQKHPRFLPQGRVCSSGRRGMSQERPAALETAPEGWRPSSAAPWRAQVGAGGPGNGHREGPPEGTAQDPHLPPGAAGLHPRPPGAAVAFPPPPHPQGPRTPLRRPPRTSRRRRPLQARRRTRVGERLGRGLSPRGQRLRPAGTKRPAGERASGQAALTADARAGARGPGAPRGRVGPGRGRAPAAVRELRGRGGSRARRPGQRRRRRSLLPPGSLLRRVFSLAGSPSPPQPRRCSGCSSPSRPGRAAGNIPESEGW